MGLAVIPTSAKVIGPAAACTSNTTFGSSMMKASTIADGPGPWPVVRPDRIAERGCQIVTADKDAERGVVGYRSRCDLDIAGRLVAAPHRRD